MNQKIAIYPNPTSGILKVIVNPCNNSGKIIVKNISGMILKEVNIVSGEISINLSSYSSGIYFIEVITEKNKMIQKVVKN